MGCSGENERAVFQRRLKWCYYMGQRRKNASHFHTLAESLRFSDDTARKAVLPRATLWFVYKNITYGATDLKRTDPEII